MQGGSRVYFFFALGIHAFNLQPGASASCLLDAIPAAKQQDILIDGQAMPVGLWQLDWTSAKLVTEIFRVLVSERLGKRAVLSGSGSSSITGYYAVAACEDPAHAYSNPNQTCGLAANQHHIALEVWVGTSASFTNAAQQINSLYPTAVPSSLGSIGYSGQQGIWVLGPNLQKARDQLGLPLEYYQSYSAAWHDNSGFFASLQGIPLDALLPCSQQRTANSSSMTQYLRSTGDDLGVVQQGGLASPRCYYQDRWWFSPACRRAPSTCVPLITGGPGWLSEQMMQLATLNNMSVGLAIAVNSSMYNQLPGQGGGTLVYWFWPDAAFVELNPQRVLFPEHNQKEWLRGLYRTAPATVVLQKLTAQALSAAAGPVLGLAQNMQIQPQDIQAMITEYKVANKTIEQVACNWLLSNQQTWQPWVPQPTDCPMGFGLVDTAGAYQTSRAQAVACAQCQPGRYSEALVCKQCRNGSFSAAFGATTCTSCGPGYFSSSNGMSACSGCLPGTYSDTKGATVCPVCSEGYYSDRSGQTSCMQCSITMPWIFSSIFYQSGRSTAACQSPSIAVVQIIVFILSMVFVLDRLEGALLHKSPIIDITTERRLGNLKVMVKCFQGHGFSISLRSSVQVRVHGTQRRELDGKLFILRFIDKAQGELLGPEGEPLDISPETSLGYLELKYALMGLFIVGEIPIVIQLCLFVWPMNLLFALMDPSNSVGSVGFLTCLPPIAFLYMCWVLRKRCYGKVRPPFVELQRAYLAEVFKQRGLCDSVRARWSRWVRLKKRWGSVTSVSLVEETSRGQARGIAAHQLCTLYRTFEGYILDRDMYYICSNMVLPLTTKDKVAFSDLVGPGDANWFVSHYWGTPFKFFVESVTSHARCVHQVLDWGQMRYWICTFSNNQWKIAEELGTEYTDCSFYLALQSPRISGTLMIMDEEALPLTRSWCLFEVFQTFLRHKGRKGAEDNFEGLLLGTSTGVLNYGHASLDVCLNIARRSLTLRVEDATASKIEDKQMIDGLVDRYEYNGALGHEAVNRLVKESILEALQLGHQAYEDDYQELSKMLASEVVDGRRGRKLTMRKPLPRSHGGSLGTRFISGRTQELPRAGPEETFNLNSSEERQSVPLEESPPLQRDIVQL